MSVFDLQDPDAYPHADQQHGRIGVARRLAEKLHGDQRRKTPETQVEHCARVAKRCEQHGERAIIVAWLHDTLEDTGLLPEVIEALFNKDILQDVLTLTHDEGESYRQYIERICTKGSDTARYVKLADLRDNQASPWPDMPESMRSRYRAAEAKILAALYPVRERERV